MKRTDVKHERELVERVAARTGLLGQGRSVAARLLAAAGFTNEVARELAPAGWGLMFKKTGLNIDNLSIDTIVHRETGETAMVVRDAGSADPRACFEVRPSGCEFLFVDPTDPQSMVAALSRSEANLVQMQLTLERIETRMEHSGILRRGGDVGAPRDSSSR